MNMNMNMNMNMSIGTDMMAVATRIQERARILMEERRKVIDQEQVLIELRTARHQEQAINDRRRKHLLERLNERNAVELEIFDVRDAIHDHKENTEVAEQQTIESEQRIELLVEKRTHETTAFYGPNHAQMESYSVALKTVVESKERDIERRRKRLESIRGELANSKTQEESIRRETETIREAMTIRGYEYGTGGDRDGATTTTSDTNNGNRNSKSNGAGSSNGLKKKMIGQEDEDITILSKRVRETIDRVRIVLCHVVSCTAECWHVQLC